MCVCVYMYVCVRVDVCMGMCVYVCICVCVYRKVYEQKRVERVECCQHSSLHLILLKTLFKRAMLFVT